jgi:hypothetical protein
LRKIYFGNFESLDIIFYLKKISLDFRWLQVKRFLNLNETYLF